MTEDWLARWEQGRIGWHEPDGNAALKAHWPELPDRGRVLVPLCGKTPDLAWIANRGYDVTGVELSSIACRAFFEEQQLDYRLTTTASMDHYVATELPLRIVCGDYFDFHDDRFDALFDRGSLVTFTPDMRPRYVDHTRALISDVAYQLLLTLEYDQAVVDGPPWAVMADEVRSYWPELRRLSSRNDIDDAPPKFREAGLTEVIEVAWSSVPEHS